MHISFKMNLRFKLVLLLLIFLVALGGYVAADSNNENSQRVRAAPLKNTTVIDGSSTKASFGSEKTIDEFGDRKVGRVSVSTVALFTLAMAAATGLGAIPFFFVELDPQWEGICNGMAAGVMLAASFDLIQEGREHGSTGNMVVLGILAGAIFIWFCKKVMTLGQIWYLLFTQSYKFQ